MQSVRVKARYERCGFELPAPWYLRSLPCAGLLLRWWGRRSGNGGVEGGNDVLCAPFSLCAEGPREKGDGARDAVDVDGWMEIFG